MNESAVELARDFMGRLLDGDVEGALACYHDDARVWRNVDGRELVMKQVVKVFRFLVVQKDLRYEDVRITGTETGFVQQHTLCCTAPGGEAVAVAACIVARVEAGRIRRLDEYMDAAAMEPLMRG